MRACAHAGKISVVGQTDREKEKEKEKERGRQYEAGVRERGVGGLVHVRNREKQRERQET